MPLEMQYLIYLITHQMPEAAVSFARWLRDNRYDTYEKYSLARFTANYEWPTTPADTYLLDDTKALRDELSENGGKPC